MRSVLPVETPSSYREVDELLSQRLNGKFLEPFHNGKEACGGWRKGLMGVAGEENGGRGRQSIPTTTRHGRAALQRRVEHAKNRGLSP